jgi:hypothetical protein
MGEQKLTNNRRGLPGPDNKISVKAARKMLGLISRNYSDDDLQAILAILYGMSEEAYEIYRCETE